MALKRKLAYVFCGLVAVTILLSVVINNSVNRNNLKPAIIKTETIQPNRPGSAGHSESKEGNKSATLESGPTTKVPWQNEEKFLTALKDNQNPIMMAAYQTVLHDPLPGEENNVHLAAKILAGTVVKPGQVFSQNAAIGPYNSARGFQKWPVYIGTRLSTTTGGGVCKVASTLYNVTVLSNLRVIERHSHGMPVPYVPYGQDATVSYGSKDFKFQNNTDFPVLIWSQGVGSTLYIAFYGKDTPPRVEWHHQFLKNIKSSKIYQNNSSLPPNSEKVVVEGMDGAVVRSWVSIKNPDGVTTQKSLGRSYYNPMPSIIEKGTSAPASQLGS
jgi:vancomycin resistance protein YoaR